LKPFEAAKNLLGMAFNGADLKTAVFQKVEIILNYYNTIEFLIFYYSQK
jgi:hypothetical protein